jgi:hypothetical protein
MKFLIVQFSPTSCLFIRIKELKKRSGSKKAVDPYRKRKKGITGIYKSTVSWL